MSTIKLKRTQEIALIGLLSAVNIASRIFMQGMPNVKPVTSIIMISVIVFGLLFAIKLTVISTIVSNLFLGMGIWTFFQILAWICICLLTQFLIDVFARFNKKVPLFVMAVFAAVMGYVFGFIVSMDKLVMGGPIFFWSYYISGLLFDTFHAVGNFVFYLVCAPMFEKIFVKQSQRMTHSSIG